MIDFDPFSHALHDDPYPVYEQLRDEFPVIHNPRIQLWVISRYDDVYEGMRQPLVYSSERIGMPAGASERTATRAPMMILMDPPAHDDLRALVNRSFTPRRIAELEPRVRAIASELIDGFIERGECELFSDFSAPLPTIVISELLGIPAADREMFKEQSTAVVAASGPGGGSSEDAARANQIMAAYLAEQFAEKRKRPRDDLMSALLEAELDGRRLTEPELLGFAVLLLIAGNETTTNLVSSACVLLAEHPDQRARLVADPGLIPRGVEEFLRCESPVQGIERDLTADVVVQGEKIPAGSKVFLLLASANRDPRRIADPERFDVGRHPNRHLSFAFGTHFCLGASLARLEARVAFEEILRRLPEFRVSGPVKRLHSGVIRGLLEVPLEFETA